MLIGCILKEINLVLVQISIQISFAFFLFLTTTVLRLIISQFLFIDNKNLTLFYSYIKKFNHNFLITYDLYHIYSQYVKLLNLKIHLKTKR